MNLVHKLNVLKQKCIGNQKTIQATLMNAAKLHRQWNTSSIIIRGEIKQLKKRNLFHGCNYLLNLCRLILILIWGICTCKVYVKRAYMQVGVLSGKKPPTKQASQLEFLDLNANTKLLSKDLSDHNYQNEIQRAHRNTYKVK
eukprot:m.237457 g.237457  ORF g.237457 m.237457 type:complete len:142 (+) comp16057_c0_seq14:1288-1713(+)